MELYRCNHVDCGKPLDLRKISLSVVEDWVYDPRTFRAWCPEHIPKIYDTKKHPSSTWGVAGYRVVGCWEDEAWITEN